MPSQLYSVVVDAHDPAALAGFRASALGYSVAYTLPDEVAIEAPDDTGPAIVFASVLGVGGQRASPRAPTAPRSNCRSSSITACRFPVLPSLEAIAVAARP